MAPSTTSPSAPSGRNTCPACYGDFQPDYDFYDPDFIIQVAVK
jgi:hypothetical protein